MSTTTIRLPDDLKARIAAAAKRAGTTTHSFILEAIAEKADEAERRSDFNDNADRRYAQIVATGKAGDRSIPVEAFFTETFATSLGMGELVTQVRIPVPAAGSGSAYAKHPDAASGYAVVGVAALVTVAGGKVTAARVAITGLSSKATRLTAVEGALVGQAATAGSVGSAAHMAGKGMDLYDDARGSAAYKANLAAVYATRALTSALARAAG